MNLRKVTALLITLCMILSLVGCTDAIPEVIKKIAGIDDYPFIGVMLTNIYDDNYQSGNHVSNIQWQRVRLSEEDSQQYPELAKTFDNLNQTAINETSQMESEFDSLYFETAKYMSNPSPMEYKSKLYFIRADKDVVSFLDSVYSYTGGAHGNSGAIGYNFSPETGAGLSLTEIITDTGNLSSLLEKALTEKYPDIHFFSLKDTLDGKGLNDFSWTVDYQGVTFWFSPYELASYADGTLSAKIWYEDYPDMFNKKYFSEPEEYAICLPAVSVYDFDLVANDGVRDKVSLYTYDKLTINVNEKTYSDEANHGYSYDTYLVHKKDKNYIYSDYTSEHDYHMLCVFDINNNIIRPITEMMNTQLRYQVIDEGNNSVVAYYTILNNPKDFALSTRMVVLGTREGYANYTVSDADGLPVMTDNAYNIDDGIALTTSVNLKATRVSNDKETDLPAGTVLYALRTDANTYVDLKTEDGTEVRLSFDGTDSPGKICGMPENQCFDNLMYAG